MSSHSPSEPAVEMTDVASMATTDALQRTGTYTGPICPDTLLPHGSDGTMLYDQTDGANSVLESYSGPWVLGLWHGNEGTLAYCSGDVYQGAFDEGQRHGSGTMKWKDQRQYTGDFFNDKRHGQGSFAWPDGAIYQGAFENNQRSGYGTYQAQTVSYQGEWKDGVYHGQGLYKYQQNGQNYVYRGNFANGKPHGTGVLVGGENGATQHDGEWQDGKPVEATKEANGTKEKTFITVVHNHDWHDLETGDLALYRGLWHTELLCPVGNGSLEFQQGLMLTYEGCFKEPGFFHGEGRLQWRNGDVYEGEFDMGQRHGQGRYCWADGRHYQGQFHQNLRHGYGRFMYPNNDFYEGNFEMGKRHGQGRFVFANGSLYDGEWHNGLYEGKGKLVHSDGKTYSGLFEAGVAHGWGVEHGPTGNITYEGEWIHGQRADQIQARHDSILLDETTESDQTGVNDDYYDNRSNNDDRFGAEPPLGPEEVLQAPNNKRLTTADTVIKTGHDEEAKPDPDMLRVWTPQAEVEVEPECEAVVDQVVPDAQGNMGKYTGIVIKGTKQPHGVGRMVYADGKRIHEGFWVKGNKQGHGRCLFTPQNDFHEGEYNMNLRHGPGRYVWSDGRTYVGGYKNDKRHGHGVFLYPSGDRYEGSFADGARSGYGQFIFEDGNGVYNGEWMHGKYHGKGRLAWGNNSGTSFSYEGEFKCGSFHGYGVKKGPSGEVLHAGAWVEGKLLSEEEDETLAANVDQSHAGHIAVGEAFHIDPTVSKITSDFETISM